MKNLFMLVALLSIVGCGQGGEPPKHFTVAYEASFSTALLDVYRQPGASGPLPTIVFIHGGGFFSGSIGDGAKYASHLCGKGLEVISIGYRLAPAATWPAPLDDVRSALRYVRANATALGSSGKIAVMGASAGACLAELLALKDDPVDGKRPDCLVAISGYGDLSLGPARSFSDFDSIMSDLFGHPPPFSGEELLALSPARCVRKDVQALVVHSQLDTNVFVDQGDAFVTALAGVGAEVHYLRRFGYAHGDDLWMQDGEARQEIANFVLDKLR